MCWKCADRGRIRDKEKRENNIEESRKRELEKYNKLKQDGICTYCKHEKAMTGRYKCKKCLDKLKRKRDANRMDIIRYERVSYGLCYICGKNEIMEDKKVCEGCYKTRLNCINKIMYMPVSKQWREDNKLVFRKG